MTLSALSSSHFASLLLFSLTCDPPPYTGPDPTRLRGARLEEDDRRVALSSSSSTSFASLRGEGGKEDDDEDEQEVTRSPTRRLTVMC